MAPPPGPDGQLPAWWVPAAPPPEHLRTVEDAVWGDRRLRLTYARFGREPAERVVDPYALVVKAGIWYLVAALATPGAERPDRDGHAGPRVYRVSRIQSAALLAESSVRPADFDLAAFWAQQCAEFLASRPRYMVRMRADPALAARLARHNAWSGDGLPPRPPEPDDPDGWVTFEVNLETPEIAHAEALRYGPDAEVLAPPELRARLAATAQQLAARYDS
jgi:predicted DNA-binding transcriptional regulator YafY